MQSTDADIVRAFEAKANQVATDNGWTIGRAESVMLRYLRDTSPAEAATIAAALQQRTAPTASPRYIVNQLGLNYFAVRDLNTELDVAVSSARGEADAKAAALNATV